MKIFTESPFFADLARTAAAMKLRKFASLSLMIPRLQACP
jgi:hypothetical protein